MRIPEAIRKRGQKRVDRKGRKKTMYALTMTDYDRRVYETELKDFLPNTFIDIHTHIWKESFRPYGNANGGSQWTRRVADEQTAEALTDGLKRLYPGKRVVPLVFGGCDQDLEQCNDYVRESAEKYGFPTLLRTDYSMSAQELEKQVKKNGCLGLKPYLTGCPPYIPSEELRIFDFLPREHLEAANKNGWIIMLHIPRSKRLRDPVNVAQLLEIEKRYPDIRLIVAHIGRAYAAQDIGDAFELLGRTEHMMFDFAANLCDDAIKACIAGVGTKRLMFGSDLPIAAMRMYRYTKDGVYYNVVPGKLYGDVSGEPHMQETDDENVTLMVYEQLRAFKRCAIQLSLKDGDIEDIMYENARRLLNGVD